MIKDRGTIKWASMMLPEHLELLREYKEEYMEQPRELTEWELEELQKTINQAFNQQLTVTVEVWKDHTITQWTGIVKSMNTNELILETLLKTESIPIPNIQSAQLDADYYD